MVGTGSALQYPDSPWQWTEQIMWFNVIWPSLLMSFLLKKWNHFFHNSASFGKGNKETLCRPGYFLSWAHFSFEWDFLQPCTQAIFFFGCCHSQTKSKTSTSWRTMLFYMWSGMNRRKYSHKLIFYSHTHDLNRVLTRNCLAFAPARDTIFSG